jgi:hypothetical protein
MEEGNCFYVAAQPALHDTYDGDDPDAKDLLAALSKLSFGDRQNVFVVHGLVTRPSDKHVHWHAWVEIDFNHGSDIGVVLDYANGLRVSIPRNVYYQKGNITTRIKYPLDLAAEKMALTGHYGPWNQKEH